MKRMRKELLSALVLLTPVVVSAQTQTIANIVGIFNVFVGVMLSVALLTYFFGMVLWSIRLGTWPSYRTEAIKIMEWSVAMLFMLIILLGVVQFFQNHQQAAAYVVSALVLIGIVWAVVLIMSDSGDGHDKGGGGHGE